ncbi:MAG: hypothetical protein MZV65_29625 [Chromatiales bacterium]|nr:hypothetical protein [Chromatiales bacterium]
MLMRFDRDWHSLLPDIQGNDKKRSQNARTVVRDGLTAISPVFKEQQFILGEYSLVDCSLAPILLAPAAVPDRSAAPGQADPRLRRPAVRPQGIQAEPHRRRARHAPARQVSRAWPNARPGRTCCAPCTSGRWTAATRRSIAVDAIGPGVQVPPVLRARRPDDASTSTRRR